MRVAETFAAFLAGAASVSALNHVQAKRVHLDLDKRAVVYSTHTSTIITTSVTTVPFTVNTNIGTTGAVTLIPGQLTVTFDYAGAYVYVETSSISTVTQTSYSTKKVAITSTTAPKVTSPLKKATSSARVATTSGKAATKAATAKPTTATAVLYTNPPLVTPTNDCPNYCGSGRACYQGKCYYFAVDDDNCGSPGNVCPQNWGCADNYCRDLQNDPDNCGSTLYVCGTGYSCSAGKCINLTSDDNNCGALNSVCAAGTGCANGVCIDTTSDPNNCSEVGYKCPNSQPTCANSYCQ